MIVVIGSGLAGISAALSAASHLTASQTATPAHATSTGIGIGNDPATTTACSPVLLLTKGALTESNTRYAQGGIAAALGPEDSAQQHATDTHTAGAGLSDPEAVRILTEEGPARVCELIASGVPFDREADGTLARGLEGAHGRPRILHAGGDATGAHIELTLAARLRQHRIEVREHCLALDLILTRGRATGVRVLDAAGGIHEIAATAVILATGGAGHLFSHTTNPEIATGDGVALAWRAGALLTDLEFFQFHPTALAAPGSPLISEAVRGAGAVLRDAAGERFMPAAHPQAELAPRDVVAREMARVMAAQQGQPVWLDATAITPIPSLVEQQAIAHSTADGNSAPPAGSEAAANARRACLEERFPALSALTRAEGYDWATEWVPVTPAAHSWMGGVHTDPHGRSSIPGLYAAGEVARTGVHGANRLASNSLLEGLVFGHRAGLAAVSDGPVWLGPLVERSTLVPVCSRSPQDDTLERPLSPQAGQHQSAPQQPVPQPPLDREGVRALAWRALGLSRTGASLAEARDRFRGWAHQAPAVPLDRAGWETRNLATAGWLLAEAALARTESRGAHQRTDFPDTDPSQARSRPLAHGQAATQPASRLPR